MKTPFAALFAFTLLAASNATYQCLESAPFLYCCKNHPFACQICAFPVCTHFSFPIPQLQLTISATTIVRDPNRDPTKPAGSYQPADLAAFTAACESQDGSWPACCYIDSKIVGWLLYFTSSWD